MGDIKTAWRNLNRLLDSMPKSPGHFVAGKFCPCRQCVMFERASLLIIEALNGFFEKHTPQCESCRHWAGLCTIADPPRSTNSSQCCEDWDG